MEDGLSAPLLSRSARRAATKGKSNKRFPLARFVFLAILVVFAGIALRVYLVEDPEGGRPSAEVAINTTRDANEVAGAVSTPQATISAEPETFAPVEGGPSITILGDTPPAESSIIALNAQGVIPDLTEETAEGPIPRIGSDGRTPFAAYSRPPDPNAAGKPQIAIIVTGLGLNEAGTLEAIGTLPDDVTLAFAPYGKTLESTTSAARAEGHELFLEVPLEPFDYPANDPGPETLLTGEAPRANLDKLFWLMARFGGYAGLINYMGARFTSSGADFGPVMEELGSRGLGYLDDGSSNRSLAPQLASTSNVPFSRVDAMLDGNPARDPILAQLTALEEKAKADGNAIGIVSALPVSVTTVAEWAAGLEDRGIALVPATALMGKE
jgi:uncharacterized protein